MEEERELTPEIMRNERERITRVASDILDLILKEADNSITCASAIIDQVSALFTLQHSISLSYELWRDRLISKAE